MGLDEGTSGVGEEAFDEAAAVSIACTRAAISSRSRFALLCVCVCSNCVVCVGASRVGAIGRGVGSTDTECNVTSRTARCRDMHRSASEMQMSANIRMLTTGDVEKGVRYD